MAKRKSRFWENQFGNVFFGVISLVLMGALIYGFSVGWFDNLINIEGDTLDVNMQERFENPSADSECSFNINPKTVVFASATTATITDGANTYCEIWGWMEGDGVWTEVWEGTTNSNGIATHTENMYLPGTFHFRAACDLNGNDVLDTEDCVTNEQTLIVQPDPTDDGFDVGDEVDSGSGGGSASPGEGSSTEITLDGWTPGGPYTLGARIYRSWDIPNPECEMPQQYPVTWTFYDSNGMAWQIDDYMPITDTIEVCPVTYHPDAPWTFEMKNYLACDIAYDWKVTAYICEVDE